jgi:hypothetical protein
MAAQQGYLPCFHNYRFRDFPIADLYSNSVHLGKVKQLLSCVLDLTNPMRLCSDFGVGKEIQPIRPGDIESDRLIKAIGDTGFPLQLYRIDYGKTPLRVIFAIQNDPRMIHIIMIDTKHKTYNGKNKR